MSSETVYREALTSVGDGLEIYLVAVASSVLNFSRDALICEYVDVVGQRRGIVPRAVSPL